LLLAETVYIFLITYLCFTHFTCCLAFSDVADLSDGDNFYLHCSFWRRQMRWGWGWALVNLATPPLQWHLLLAVPRRCSHFSLHKWLFIVSVSLHVLCFVTICIHVVSMFMFVRWLSVVYGVFPARTLSSHSSVLLKASTDTFYLKGTIPFLP